MKKLLFNLKSDCTAPIIELMEKQNHRTVILWALDCAQRFAALYENYYPDDAAVKELICIANAWSQGEIKMPEAKRAILAVHNTAKLAEQFPAAQAAARAVCHAAATVHVKTHAVEMVFYGLTGLVYAAKPQYADAVAIKECAWFYGRLKYWEAHADLTERKWAKFL